MKRALLMLVMCVTLAISAPALAVTVDLAWSAPTTNEDGSPLVDIGQTPTYKIYAGTQPGQYSMTFEVNNEATTTTIDIPAAIGERWYFAATCLDLVGNESAYSGEVNYYFPTPEDLNTPAAPGTPTVTGAGAP